jgi:hypothetical protein
MNCASFAGIAHQAVAFLLTCTILILQAEHGRADDPFSFNMEEFEKKNLEFNGFLELRGEQNHIDEDAALTRLNFSEEPTSTLERLVGTVQFGGSYSRANASLHWLLMAAGQQDNEGWIDTSDVFEAYLGLKPVINTEVFIGKKSYNWGKGYAWNPVGFINRTKDPNDPDESREGYIILETDVIKSFTGALQNAALTGVVLPVLQDINEDYGEKYHVNLAAKLYLLYLDTDIDLIAFTGSSRSNSFGIDFSRNITTNFEIHGEAAYFSDQKKIVLAEDGSNTRLSQSATSLLLGLRHLSTFDLTTIIEYYHNGNGYSEAEMSRFYTLVDNGSLQVEEDGADAILQQARLLALQGYGRPFLGRDYLYARVSLKEPADILYLTPALTAILNLDDQSFSITPEIIYTGFTNWELRLKFAYLGGGSQTEYGEKQNGSKVELRLRYFF